MCRRQCRKSVLEYALHLKLCYAMHLNLQKVMHDDEKINIMHHACCKYSIIKNAIYDAQKAESVYYNALNFLSAMLYDKACIAMHCIFI